MCPGVAQHPLPAGKYIENHGVVHNMFYNLSNRVKLPYHPTLSKGSWWDNGSIPIWITAQRQVPASPHVALCEGGVGRGGRCGLQGRFLAAG